MDLSIQRLNNFIKEKTCDELNKNEHEINNNSPKIRYTKKNTNIITRSQKSKEKD